jgi:NADPH:quinone reductase-like Zn-dependent oxidoreductase
MRAVICTAYGPPEVLQLQEIAEPQPRAHEVLIRVRATAVTASDVIVRGFRLPWWHPIGFMMGVVAGFRRPRNPILGMVFSGEIAAIGGDVTRFAVGDAVFGMTGTRFGCYAEYTAQPENDRPALFNTVPCAIAHKPATLGHEDCAALVYGPGMAWHFLRRAGLRVGQSVLIYGASGSIGTAAVQLAAGHFGARVTAVCSGANEALVRELGATDVIDYTRQDQLPSGARFDLVFDAVGKRKSSPLKEASRGALNPGGQAISVDDGTPAISAGDLDALRGLIDAGVLRPVIDRSYPLAEIVAAHRYVEGGHKAGDVVIAVA